MPQPFIQTRTHPSAMRILLLLIGLVLLGDAHAETPSDALEIAYQAARTTYRARHYEEAANMLEALLKTHPDCARCAHLLGKSYGRLAQRANWLSAMDLARKTCNAFELAVRLDPEDEGALEDLVRYYRAAPEFLGGGADKARNLEQKLRELQARHPD
jgi:tetratricopeptide (TPR) repeat protein